ncbi:MAG TPA: CotH kinase family protein [Kiritimatiellia bacterium]|nr:CotH kinase family protein [Kiritimatiellia bacterium]
MPSAPVRAVRWAAAAVAAAYLALAVFVSPEWIFEGRPGEEQRLRERLSRALASRSGLLHLITFDEPAPCDFITGHPLLCPGTTSAPGRFGAARKFDGRERTYAESRLRWDRIGSSFTLSFWIRMPEGRPDQCIWYRAGKNVQVGFHLEAGRMTFDMPTPGGRQRASYPFVRYGEFVHLAATVDAERGEIILYENGSPMAREPFVFHGMPRENMAFGKPVWYAARNSFRGWLDEASVWNRALSEQEIRGLARAKRGLLWTGRSGRRCFKWRAAQTGSRILRVSAALPDVFAPLTRRGRSEARAISRLDELRLILPGKVRRELIAAHHRSLKSGRRTQAGARPRQVHVAFRGEVYPALICLSGSDREYHSGKRPGYELQLLEGAQVLGARRLLLSPPENGHWLFPVFDARLRHRLGLPSISGGLCRLRINGLSRGVYAWSVHDRLGLLPGDLPDVCMGAVRHPSQWWLPFHEALRPSWESSASRAAWPLSSAEMKLLYDEVVGEYGGCLRGDLQNPLSRKEISWRLARGRQQIESIWQPAPEHLSPARRAAGFLDEFMVLGSNASPDRIVAPLQLDLAALRNLGVEIRWSSSNPDVLDHAGHVARNFTGGPVRVVLTAAVEDGTESVEKVLTFRVMPRRIALPAIFLNVRHELDKSRRADAAVEFCGAGEDFPSRIRYATQGTRGGMEHRGNSSYWNPKKLFSLKMDEPHGFLDESGSRVLLAVNSQQDPSFVRNGLAYDLFRSWAGEGAPRFAPQVRHAEVFVNGRYQGLYELASRVDETLLNGGSPPADAHKWIIYRHETVHPRIPDMRARRPAGHEGEFSGPYRSFCRFLEQPGSESWEPELARTMDIPNLADYQLLLNLFQNRNGYPFDFLLHEVLVCERDRPFFFHVPWDFELGAAPGQWEWLASGLMQRLENESPRYRGLLSARWRELRESGLTPESLNARIDAVAENLRDYADWDYRRWRYHAGRDYGLWVNNLKAVLNESIERMDLHLDFPPVSGSLPTDPE